MNIAFSEWVLFRAFLTEVCSSFDSESISSLHELAAVLHVLAVIGRSEFTSYDFRLFY